MISSGISIVVPVYNAEKFICTCLESLVKQTSAPGEIIVVDNNSSDHSAQEIKKFINKSSFPSIVLTREEIPGPAAARNKGAFMAAGEIIAFIDADCVAPLDWTEQIIKMFESDLMIDMMVGTGIALQTDTVLARLMFLLRKKVQIRNTHRRNFKENFIFRSQGPVFASMNLAVKKTVFSELKGYDAAFRDSTGEDIEFAMRAIRQQKNISNCPHVVVYHNERNNLKAVLKQVYTYEVNDARNFKNYYKGEWVFDLSVKVIRLNFMGSTGLFDKSVLIVYGLLPLILIIQQIHWFLGVMYYLVAVNLWLMLYFVRLEKKVGLKGKYWEVIPMAFYYQVRHLGGLVGRIVGSVKYRVFYL
ncbi:MAG: glycosyltransferase [Elusimicrobia bacterium]|nr:glycosyltransferase [Elusimicrobiota bacterium]